MMTKRTFHYIQVVATVLSSGFFIYTPAPGFSGIDMFSYTASNSAGISSPATVTIHVEENDVNIAGNDEPADIGSSDPSASIVDEALQIIPQNISNNDSHLADGTDTSSQARSIPATIAVINMLLL